MLWLHGDLLRSTTNVSDASGNQVNLQRYYPYGATRTGGVGTPYRYTGQREEAALGLYDYKARWYDPAVGRFIQPDSLVPEPGTPQSLNRYAYVLNNPLRYSDPTGHWTEEQLAASLGEDWHELFFGEGALFHGREKLEFLRSAHTTSSVDLFWAARIMRVARMASATTPISMQQFDAIGLRTTVSNTMIPPIPVSAGFDIDVILNVTAGQLSYFFTASGGLGLGGAGTLAFGGTTHRKLPTNDAYQGYSDSVGITAGGGIIGNLEFFASSGLGEMLIIGDPGGALKRTHGFFSGTGLGAGVSAYETIGAAFEVRRVDERGGRWPNLSQQVAALQVTND